MTQGDIQEYVRSRFASSFRFQAIKGRTAAEEHSESLINDIVTRASGVFLWVSLVVNSLLNGSLWADSVGDLQARLNDFPDDLDEFYTRMLDTIEPIYLSESIKIFQTSIESDQALPALAYEFLLQEKASPDYALHYSPSGQTALTEVTRRTPKEMRTRLILDAKTYSRLSKIEARLHLH